MHTHIDRSIRKRLEVVEDLFLDAISAGTPKLQAFDETWSSLEEDITEAARLGHLGEDTMSMGHTVASKIAILAEAFLELEIQSTSITNSLNSDLESLFADLSLDDHSPPPALEKSSRRRRPKRVAEYTPSPSCNHDNVTSSSRGRKRVASSSDDSDSYVNEMDYERPTKRCRKSAPAHVQTFASERHSTPDGTHGVDYRGSFLEPDSRTMSTPSVPHRQKRKRSCADEYVNDVRSDPRPKSNVVSAPIPPMSSDAVPVSVLTEPSNAAYWLDSVFKMPDIVTTTHLDPAVSVDVEVYRDWIALESKELSCWTLGNTASTNHTIQSFELVDDVSPDCSIVLPTDLPPSFDLDFAPTLGASDGDLHDSPYTLVGSALFDDIIVQSRLPSAVPAPLSVDVASTQSVITPYPISSPSGGPSQLRSLSNVELDFSRDENSSSTFHSPYSTPPPSFESLSFASQSEWTSFTDLLEMPYSMSASPPPPYHHKETITPLVSFNDSGAFVGEKTSDIPGYSPYVGSTLVIHVPSTILEKHGGMQQTGTAAIHF